MAERFAQAIYELLEGTNPRFPDDCKRFLSGVQDVASDHPREKKSLGRFADSHFVEICAAAGEVDEGDIPQVISRATDYLQSEYLLEESWAAHLSEEFVLAMWAHGHGESSEWIGDQHPVASVTAAAAGTTGSAAGKENRPKKPIDESAGETEMIDDPVTGPRRETFPGDDGPEIIGAAGAGMAAGRAGAGRTGGAYGTDGRSGGAGSGGRRAGLRLPHIIGIVVIAAALAFGFAFLFGLKSCDDEDKNSDTETTTEATAEAAEEGGEGEEAEDAEATEATKSKEKKESGALKPTDRVFAHWGTGGAGIANDFPSFDYAIEQGATHIEQDVVHAYDTEQIYVYKGSISSNSVYSPNLGNCPKLWEVFERYKKKITYVVELKTTNDDAVWALIELIRDEGMENNVIVQCFDPEMLRKVRESLPGTKTMQLYDGPGRGYGDLTDALGREYVDIICVEEEKGLMTPTNCDAAHNAGKEFGAWLLNSDDQIRQAISMGVDRYFTTEPKRAIQLEEEYR